MLLHVSGFVGIFIYLGCLPKLIFKIFFFVLGQLCMFAAYLNCILVVYQFSFQHHSLPLLIACIILDVIFVLKMFLEMHKAYIDRYGDYIVDNRKIRAMYDHFCYINDL